MSNFLRRRQAKQSSLPSLVPALLFSLSTYAAPVPPDAGQTMRELQKQPELSTPKSAAPLRLEESSAPKGIANGNVRIVVKAIKVSGNSVFTTGELEALVNDLAGAERTLAELEAGASRITAYYHARGYVVARAYLPVQEIRDGMVTINVLEGRIGEQRINNRSRLSDERANDYLRGIKSGDVVQATPVDRALLLLNDTPGVGAARATLQPGASVGTSDLLIELNPSVPYSASVEADNHGNRYTGEYRMGGTLMLNSPFEAGDQLTLQALASNQNLAYVRISYHVPVGGSGLRLGAAYSDTSYRLGREFAALQAHGTAASSSLFAMYPFIRSQADNLSGVFTWEDKRLNDKTDVPATESDKQVRLASFGLGGNHQDSLGGAGMTSFDFSLAAGNLGMDTGSLANDSLPTSAQTNGGFTRFAFNINRRQRLTDTNTLSATLSGQWASKNLNSSEKFSIGGANGVRAYPQGEGEGDQGWMVNLELRHTYDPNVQGVLFYDTGSVGINRNSFAVGAANTRNISGAGVGINATLAGVQVKASMAWRTSGGQPTSESVAFNRNPRLWLLASKQF